MSDAQAQGYVGGAAAGCQVKEDRGESLGIWPIDYRKGGEEGMQGFLLCAALVAVLVGLGALMEPARPPRGGPGRRRKPPS
jgi:hypothetical protein